MQLVYVTGNSHKLNHAKEYLAKLDVEIEQKDLNIDEIQSDSIVKIAQDKAKKAFEIIGKPLVVSDSGWEIPSLNNFPGSYMKYINEWFTVDDFLNLMKGKSDRSITLIHVLALASERGIKIFEKRIQGKISEIPDGDGNVVNQLIILEGNKNTIARNNQNHIQSTDDTEIWVRVVDWLKM